MGGETKKSHATLLLFSTATLRTRRGKGAYLHPHRMRIPCAAAPFRFQVAEKKELKNSRRTFSWHVCVRVLCACVFSHVYTTKINGEGKVVRLFSVRFAVRCNCRRRRRRWRKECAHVRVCACVCQKHTFPLDNSVKGRRENCLNKAVLIYNLRISESEITWKD